MMESPVSLISTCKINKNAMKVIIAVPSNKYESLNFIFTIKTFTTLRRAEFVGVNTFVLSEIEIIKLVSNLSFLKK